MNTDPNDPVHAYSAALPAHLRTAFRTTQRIVALIHCACREQGWTVEQLAHETTRDTAGVVNLGGLITYRLEWCAQHPPAAPGGAPRRVPFCSPSCRDNAGWVLDDDQLPASRCQCRMAAPA